MAELDGTGGGWGVPGEGRLKGRLDVGGTVLGRAASEVPTVTRGEDNTQVWLSQLLAGEGEPDL